MPLISNDLDMIEKMEADLVAKIAAALEGNPNIDSMAVHGIFSLDHLETMLASQLCNDIGVGVGFVGAERMGSRTDLNVDRSNPAAMLDFKFVVVLAVPTEESCGTRHNATRLLTLMRRGILGKTIANDSVSRTWNFVSEHPEISASTKQMLYYAQVWQVSLPTSGL